MRFEPKTSAVMCEYLVKRFRPRGWYPAGEQRSRGNYSPLGTRMVKKFVYPSMPPADGSSEIGHPIVRHTVLDGLAYDDCLWEQQDVVFTLVIALSVIVQLTPSVRAVMRLHQRESVWREHSSFTDFTHRSENAFKLGLCGGNRSGLTRPDLMEGVRWSSDVLRKRRCPSGSF